MPTFASSQYGVTCRETHLVILAARAFISGGNDECFQAALAQPVDWTAVEDKSNCHSITPVVALALKRYGGSLVPSESSQRFQQRFLQNARSNLVRLQEWIRIIRALEAAGIRAISLKGPALALLAYGDVALREFADLDLLIQPKDVLSTRDFLVREDYGLLSSLRGDSDAALCQSSNRQLDFVHNGQGTLQGTLIDLHWGALHEMFSFQLPSEQLFASAQLKNHEGISFLTLSPEYMLLYLCAHGTKHSWLKLRWLCDVACHVHKAQGLDWGLCIRLAEAANCDLVLKHSLLLVHQVLGLDLPSPISNYCDDAKARELAVTAMSLLFQEDNALGYGEAMRYHLAFAKCWRDRAHFVFQRLIVPDEQDWQEIRLPQSLGFLYYTVRPLRFMRARLLGNAGVSN